MEELSVILLELLPQHNRVSLPGIGSFLVNDMPARIDEDTNRMLPPSKKVVFSKKETWNDGLLEAAYAARFNLSENEAQERVRHLMMDIRFDLDDKRKVSFPNLGVLRQTQHNTIELEQKNNLVEILGLAPIPLNIDLNGKKRQKNRQEDNDIEKDNSFFESLSSFRVKPQNIALAIFAGLIGLLVAIILIAVFINKSSNSELLLLPPENPFSSDIDNPPVLTDSDYEHPSEPQIADPDEELVPEKPKLKQPPTPMQRQSKKKETKMPSAPALPAAATPAQRIIPDKKPAAENRQYCIIIASVLSREAAERKVSMLKEGGYGNVHYIAEVKSGRYRIAINCFDSEAQARRELSKVKESITDAWVLER